MKGAENIRGVILEEAKENAEKIAAESRKKCKKISDEGQAKAAELLEKAQKETDDTVRSMAERSDVDGRLYMRKIMLGKKQEIIAAVYQKTLERISALEGEEYLSFLTAVIKRSAEGGEVVLSETDREKYGESLMSRLGEAFTLAEKGENIGKGAVIRQDRIEINCKIASLVQRLSETEGGAVSDILFGG